MDVINSSMLKNRIDLYTKQEIKNKFNEVSYKYKKEKSIWASILPTSVRSKEEDIAGESIRAVVTHKIKVRKSAISEVRNDMYFMYRGQKYEVMYYLPNYKYNNAIEFYCKLILEGEEDYE